MTSYGFTGQVLRVDLSRGDIRPASLPEALYRQYVGGLGLGARLLYDELPLGVGPLDPENLLLLLTGPLTGTTVPSSSNCTAVTLHAGTGFTIGAGHTHGYFGALLKIAGYDGIILSGAAPNPVYLWIHDREAELRDASPIWGKDTHETEDLVRAEIGDAAASVSCIGPAGENLLHGALIETDKHHHAVKGGVGTVMGSKKLKAIAVSGRGGPGFPIADPRRFLAASLEWKARLGMRGQSVYMAGTTTDYYNRFAEQGTLIAGKNLTSAAFGDQYAQSVVEGFKRFKVKPTACWGCPVACAYMVEVTDGPYKGYRATLGGGSENREGASAMVGIMEPGTVQYLTDLYDRLGLDSGFGGTAIGMAMECYEKGIITRSDTGGLDLTWGNTEAVVTLIHQMVRREGFGAVLAHGARQAAEMIGGEAPNFVIHVKGTDVQLHDWRKFWSIVLGSAVSDSVSKLGGSGCDRHPNPDLGYPTLAPHFVTDKKADDVMQTTWLNGWENSLGICIFGKPGGLGAIDIPVRALAAATGWADFDRDEMWTVGQRVVNVMRAFNVRRGLTLKDDLDLGPRYLEAPRDGGAAGKTVAPHLKDLIQEYYRLNGWDEESSKPLPETLARLGLDDIARDLWESEPAKVPARRQTEPRP